MYVRALVFRLFVFWAFLRRISYCYTRFTFVYLFICFFFCSTWYSIRNVLLFYLSSSTFTHSSPYYNRPYSRTGIFAYPRYIVHLVFLPVAPVVERHANRLDFNLKFKFREKTHWRHLFKVEIDV